jgi:hypothetical protein
VDEHDDGAAPRLPVGHAVAVQLSLADLELAGWSWWSSTDHRHPDTVALAQARSGQGEGSSPHRVIPPALGGLAWPVRVAGRIDSVPPGPQD